MIPKTIHYCWFGPSPKSELITTCLASWKATCPDFEIKEWNESNFAINSYPFTKKMYREKKWAFVADFARLKVLHEHGGIYLDTDMELVQSLTPLLNHSLLLGKESEAFISCGMIGAVEHHPFIESFLAEYSRSDFKLEPNPVILTRLFNKKPYPDTYILPPIAFYPYDSKSIRDYKRHTLTQETYGVHLWNYSWGHPLNRFFKRIGIYYFGKKVVESLGMKKILKKILGFV
jgi:Glycosyltransferase sugar-binding region containing DXD motif